LRKYELLCILKTGFDIESADQIISQIENAVKNYEGTVISTTKIGRKKLAYDINKNRDAFYVVFDIQLKAAKVAELKRYLKLNESVLRGFITVKEEKKAKVAS
jgi:small subunit ribosomal protein S6